MKFSIIVVALNPGEKLKETIDSILCQTYTDYEIVVKDGGSKDGSVQVLPEDARIQLYIEKDTGIYDAMNQAVQKARGEYILFLNCGDSFYDEKVLERAAACIEREQEDLSSWDAPLVVYGDTYSVKNDVMLTAPGKIDGFACYRNIPCHQSCFYATELCKKRPYRPEYRIRADYDHFLWCYYTAQAKMVHMGSIVAFYEGGGYSESKENRERDKEEHRLITEEYMDVKEIADYRRTLMLTLVPLRRVLAENKLTAWVYHWLKDCICHHKLRILLGFVFLAVELYLLLGTGVMGQDVVNFHTGEGSWELQMTAESPEICQEFIPQYDTLRLVSVLVYKENITAQDAGMRVVISDWNNEIVYQKDLDIAQVENGRFTDIEVNLELSAGKKYYLTVLSEPSAKGEYPAIGVCGTEYLLPENGELVHGEALQGVQMVSRYHYVGALTSSKLCNALLVAVITALGIMFGLPQNKYLRRAAGVVLFLAAPYVLGQRLELLTYNPMFYLPISMKWNLGIMYALEVIVLLVTHSLSVSVVLTNVALTILYSTNYFVLMYRGTSLRMNDFAAIGTAADVVADFDLIPDSHLAMAWALLVLIVVYGAQTRTWRIARVKATDMQSGAEGKEARSRQRNILKVLSYVLTIGIAVAVVGWGGHKLLYTDYLNDVGFADKEYFGINFELIYANNGYLVGTCVEVKNSRIEEPTGYSVEQVEGILTEASTAQEADEELPHVILIMNESLADIHTVADVELTQDNMPFLHSLQENTLKGYVNASVLGGGTANSEFEVFTGCATAFLPVNYYPYQQAMRRPMSSMVSQMEEYGYTTIAMHPVRSSNWNRKNVYKYLGFDEMLFEEDFVGAKVVHSGVSDAETYKRIIELYEGKTEEEKLFVFDLTMQNHGGYNKNNKPDEVQALGLNNPQIDEYLSVVKVSDEAFADLVGYFEKEDEKVIICMFGDHQPWIFSDIEEEYLVEAESVEERTMNNYRTPFVIWANYDIEEADDYDISMNYLGGLLQRTAGIPLSPYFVYLEQLREEYPIITVNGYIDSEGNYYNWDGSANEFAEYRMLQYNYLYDATVEWGY